MRDGAGAPGRAGTPAPSALLGQRKADASNRFAGMSVTQRAACRFGHSMLLARHTVLSLMLVAGTVFCHAARGQCGTAWSSPAPEPALAGDGRCSAQWDPDGTGPLPTQLVVGGSALVGGTSPVAQKVMTFDGSRWQALGVGPGTSGEVTLLLRWNGTLIAAGTFTGGGTDHIAAWSGSAWLPLGAGLISTPVAMCEWNGNVAVALPGNPTPVQLWNGAAWTNLPPAMLAVKTMISFQGELCVGGAQSYPGPGRLARWNGTTWSPVIPANNEILCMAVRQPLAVGSTPILYVGGSFTAIGSSSTPAICVAQTNGGSTFTWNSVSGGIPGGGSSSFACQGLLVRNSGLTGFQIVARVSGAAANVMTSNGAPFAPLGAAPPLTSLQFFGGAYYGTASSTSAAPAACLRYSAPNWIAEVGQALDGEVRALAANGVDVIVGGTMQSSAGTAVNRIAKWNGSAFLPLGSGINGFSVDALLTTPTGDLIAGGEFAGAGGLSASNIASWNGSAWAPLGLGCGSQVLALCRLPNGDLIAGGKFTSAGGVPCARIARWNGSAWSPLGLGMNGDVRALAVRGDGRLFAGGDFTIAGTAACSRIAQWDGVAWSPLGLGVNGNVHALAVRPNQDIVAAGAFTTVIGVVNDRCARWNGSAWAGLGASSADPSPVDAVFALPNGDVIAGRGFHAPAVNPDAGIARWNGSQWSGFGSGLVGASQGAAVRVRAIGPRVDGAVFLGGDFGFAGGLLAQGLAILTANCPAAALSFGAGCTGSTGVLTLAAESLPWVGATCRTTTTGMAAASLSLGLTGLNQLSIPLASLLPEGQAGCVLLASADVSALQVADAAGITRSSLLVPPTASLVGTVLIQQTIPIEISGTGSLTAVRSSNALNLTIGSF